LSGGTTSFSVSSLSVGTHQITAIYSGDSIYAPSASNVISETITSSGGSAATMTFSINGSSAQLNPVTPQFFFTQNGGHGAPVTVSENSGSATGSVVLLDGNVQVGPTLSMSCGASSCSVSTQVTLSSGAHALTAVYLGNGTVASSSRSLNVQSSPKPKPR
jgi:hypothetical protein